jgi:hypothetical protein
LQKFLITSKASDDRKLSTLCEIPLYSGGAEERRLRRMEQYAASLPLRRQGEERSKATPLEPCETPSRRGDNALMVDQGWGYLLHFHLLSDKIHPRSKIECGLSEAVEEYLCLPSLGASVKLAVTT